MPGLVLVRHGGALKPRLIAGLRQCLGLVGLLVLLAPYHASAVEPLDGMTASERAATGVDRLTPNEREALNRWLSEHLGAPVMPQAAAEPTRSDNAPASDMTPSTVVAAETAQGVDGQDVAIEAEVARRVAQELAAARADEEALETGEPFEAQVLGGFTGWSGKTVFTLDNGQVWRQRHATTYRYRGDDNRVRLEANFFGLWEMTVLSTGRSVGVRRID